MIYDCSVFLSICVHDTHTLAHTHSDTSIPRVLSLFVFRLAVQGGSGYSESIQYLQSSLPLRVPWILLPSLYQAEVTDDSLFPSCTWQGAGKNRKENWGKKLPNYFKQHTKLMHCAEPSKVSIRRAAVFQQFGVRVIQKESLLNSLARVRWRKRSGMGVEKEKKSIHLLETS